MIPVDLRDVANSLAAVQALYKTGFYNSKNVYSSYKDLGEDIQKLVINLDLLLNVLQRAQYQAGPSSNGAQYQGQGQGKDSRILGDFGETIRACELTLSDTRYFQRSSGVVQSLCWDSQIESEFQTLRDRITNHNIKLSVLFSILDPQALEDRSFYVIDSTTSVLGSAEQLGRSIHEENGNNLSHGWRAANSISIPRELEDAFTKITRQTDPDLFKMARGLDGAILYFNRITKRSSIVVSSDTTYHLAIIDTTMAVWLLKAIKGTREYQAASSYPSNTVLARQLDYWGMTVERFFDRFESLLQDALRRLLGQHMVLPPTPDLLAILESHKYFGHGSQQSTHRNPVKKIQQSQEVLFELEDTSSSMPIPATSALERAEHGIKEMIAYLTSANSNYTETLQINKHTETRSSLVLVKSLLGTRSEKETTDNYELSKVQIIPSYALRTWTAPPLEPDTIIFRTDHESPVSRTLKFQQAKDMFEFQQKITGYRVVHDTARVLSTSQESKLLGGSNRQDLCRVQLWSSPTPKASHYTAPQPPPPSTSSFSPGSKRFSMSQTSLSNGSSSSFGRKSKRRSTPSIFSVASRSSSSSVAIDTPSYIGKDGIKEIVYAEPIAPCVVLFAHKAPKLSERVDGKDISRSFLTIDIGSDVTAEEELSEFEEARGSSSYCCVIERKSNYLQARRSLETIDPNLWDLATIGLSQRQRETEIVKKMKHVILQFDDKNERTQFINKFNQLKAVANLRMAKFIGATGGVNG